MALLQNEVRELISQKWRPETPRMGSLIHQLFPNEIQFTDFEYGKDVIIPLATDGVINRTWDPQTGSKSNYAENKFVKAKLDQVIDIQERIGKYESKALTPKFLENKLNRLQLQSAEIYDKYDAANLVKDGTAVTDAQPITKANILDETTKMRIFTVNNQNEFTNGFLIATSDVVSYATQAKIMSNAPDGVLNIINGVVGVINGCYVIEVPKSRLPENVSMIWVNPSAYATYTGIDLPFTTGIYTDEKFMGQVYLAEREFFTGKVAVPLSVIYHQAKATVDEIKVDKNNVELKGNVRNNTNNKDN